MPKSEPVDFSVAMDKGPYVQCLGMNSYGTRINWMDSTWAVPSYQSTVRTPDPRLLLLSNPTFNYPSSNVQLNNSAIIGNYASMAVHTAPIISSVPSTRAAISTTIQVSCPGDYSLRPDSSCSTNRPAKQTNQSLIMEAVKLWLTFDNRQLIRNDQYDRGGIVQNWAMRILSQVNGLLLRLHNGEKTWRRRRLSTASSLHKHRMVRQDNGLSKLNNDKIDDESDSEDEGVYNVWLLDQDNNDDQHVPGQRERPFDEHGAGLTGTLPLPDTTHVITLELSETTQKQLIKEKAGMLQFLWEFQVRNHIHRFIID